MNTLKILFCWSGFLLCIVLTSCSKDCNTAESPVCKTAPPVDEACQAYFESWFYNDQAKVCEKIGYSGCSATGFITREECEICLCKQ